MFLSFYKEKLKKNVKKFAIFYRKSTQKMKISGFSPSEGLYVRIYARLRLYKSI